MDNCIYKNKCRSFFETMVNYIIFFCVAIILHLSTVSKLIWQIMIRIFFFILFVIISNNSIANVNLCSNCDKDRGYNFISKDEVEVFSINFSELNIISNNHSYE